MSTFICVGCKKESDEAKCSYFATLKSGTITLQKHKHLTADQINAGNIDGIPTFKFCPNCSGSKLVSLLKKAAKDQFPNLELGI